MKRLLIVLGAAFLALIIGFGALFIYLAVGGADHDKKSKEAAGTVINTLGKSWDTLDLFQVSVPEMRDHGKTRAELVEILSAVKHRLGPIDKYDSLTGQAKITVNQNGKTVMAEYRAKIFCEKDSGRIALVLDNVDERWLLRRFHVESKAFLSK